MARDRPKAVVGVIRGVAGRVISGGALAPQPPCATRNQSDVIQIFPNSTFFPIFFLLSLLNPYFFSPKIVANSPTIRIEPAQPKFVTQHSD